MTEREAAIERLERAVARLEGARGLSDSAGDAASTQLKEIAGEIAARVDRALARIGRILGEGG